MDDFNPHRFLATKGILMRVLGVGVGSLVLFAIVAVFAGMAEVRYGVLAFGFWPFFMVVYTLYVIKENIPDSTREARSLEKKIIKKKRPHRNKIQYAYA